MDKKSVEVLFSIIIYEGIDEVKRVVDSIYEKQKNQKCSDFKGLRSMVEKEKE